MCVLGKERMETKDIGRCLSGWIWTDNKQKMKDIKFAVQMLYGEVIEDAIENMPCFIFAPKTNQCLYRYTTKIG